MKDKKNIFKIVTGILILIAVFGLFEDQALAFVKSVSEKNLKFLEMVSEVKIVMSGLSDINIPFVNSHSGAIAQDLTKAQDKLLMSNAIVLIQILLMTISKSWGVKIVLILTFALSFYKHTASMASKLLTLLLTLTPGLPIFTIIVYSLSVHSSIDFSNNYLKKLEANVVKIKSEKSTLIMQHEQQVTAEKNGTPGHHNPFRNLKENVAYDLKKVKSSIHGEFATIRLIIANAGHEMVQKVANLASMVIFCFILLPFGYLIIVYTIYKHVFTVSPPSELDDSHVTQTVSNKRSFFKRLKNVATAAWKEFTVEVSPIEHSLEKKMMPVLSHLENMGKEEFHRAQNILKTSEQRMKGNIISDLKNEDDKVKTKMHETIGAIDKNREEVVSEIENKEKSIGEAIKPEVSHVENVAHRTSTQIDHTLKTDTHTLENSASSDMKNVGEKIKKQLSETMDSVENKGEEITSEVKDIKGKNDPLISI